MKHLEICIPFFGQLFPQALRALGNSVPLLRELGWEINTQIEYNNPYISCARGTMLRRALDHKPDAIVFLDHDLSWEPTALVKLVETPGDVVCGTYRFKRDEVVEYMGQILPDLQGQPQFRQVGKTDPARCDPMDPELDHAVLAFCAPAGFLKITPGCVEHFMRSYPDLVYGTAYAPSVDLFNHGAHKGVWYGEDYAFCRNWLDASGEILMLPNLNISHWSRDENGEYTEFPGNYHWHLAGRPGGALAVKETNDAEHESDRSGVRRSAA